LLDLNRSGMNALILDALKDCSLVPRASE